MKKPNIGFRTGVILLFCAIVCIVTIFFLTQKKDHVIVKGNTLTISKDGDKTIVEICSPTILKVHHLPQGKESAHSEVVGTNTWAYNKAEINIKSNPAVIKTDKMLIKIDKTNYRISVYDLNNNLLVKEQDLNTVYDDGVKLAHNAGDNFYGINGFDAWEDSSSKLLRNSGNPVEAGKQGHAGGPFVWSTKGYGILVDSNTGNYDITDSDIQFTDSSKKDTEYYVMVGNPNEIISAEASISGKSPMFPKWAMGFTNSEWSIDETELKSIVDTYRAKNIPIDNYTLDFDWKAWSEDNYGEFRWNTTKFPDGQSGTLQKDMLDKGIKLTGIMKPRIHVDTVQGKYATDHNFWYPDKPAYLDYFSHQKVQDINFSLPDARKWFFDHLKDAYNTGIIGWWNDEADEGFDNVQFLNMQKAIYEGQRGITNNRVWSINRNFYLGAQRYGYGLWSGDINTGFDSMQMQRERMLSAINLGEVKWGMDTGGFRGTPDSENYTRWIQFSAFTPIFRVHGTENEQRQPWVYGAKAEAASKDVMQLRYKLIPYIYSYDRRAYDTGLGLVKPLFYDYPQDKNLINYTDAWMFGDYMLAAPVVETGKDTKNIYLPEGDWIDYFTGKRYEGGNTIEHKIDNENWKDVPLFIKKGAIIPTQDYMNYVGEKPVKNIYVDIFADKKATSFNYYDDDGKTYDYEKGVYFEQSMTAEDKGGSTSFSIGEKKGSYTPDLKYYILKVHNRMGNAVTIKGTALKQVSSYEGLMNSGEEGFAISKDLYGTVTYIKVTAGEAKDILITGTADLQ